jgi:WD40 repeat protein
MAANPRNASLAVGCEDGGVRLFNYDGGVGALEFMRALPTTGARVLCVAYHPVKERLFIGCDDGTIRCVDEVRLILATHRDTVIEDCLIIILEDLFF